MNDAEHDREQTAKRPLATAIGRAKEVVGSALGNAELAREGQIQKVQGETEEEAAAQAQKAATADQEAQIAVERTETEKRRRQLETELADKAQSDAIEGRAESSLAAADQRAQDANQEAETKRRAEDSAAAAQEQIAGAAEASELSEADRLRREAAGAEAAADAIDPEETD